MSLVLWARTEHSMLFKISPFTLKRSHLAVAATLPLMFMACQVRAADNVVLEDIRVEGAQRVDVGTVYAVLPFRVGDTYTDELGAAALRALFATGNFRDVRLRFEGQTLIITVQERQLINNVDFKGNKEFDRDALLKALKASGIAEGQPFDRGLADRAEQEIKREYLSRSLYGAEVTTTVTEAPGGRVNLLFTVTEGARAKISSIHVVGNRAFSERTLIGQMDLSVGGWLTWYTKSDRYSRSKLNADLESLRAYYLNRGYLEFDINSAQVTMSTDKKDISILININEGPKYAVTSVKLEGDLLGRDNEFKSKISVKPGQPYKAEDVENTIQKLTELYGFYGYAFAKVEMEPEIDRERGRVGLVFKVEPQRRVYVRRINIAGNTKTRDEVLRREFRQFESSWFDGRKIKASRDRIDRLGYFNQVTVDTQEVPGFPDQVDLLLTVEEKATGSLMLGASFSSSEKLAFSAGIKIDNVFGSGNYLGIEVNTSKSSRTVVLSSVDPYFTDSGISRSFDIFYRTNKPLNSQGEEYTLITPGANLKFGVPFSDLDTVYFGLGLEQTTIQGSSSLPNSYYTYRERYGKTSTSVPLTIGWSRDSRDSAIAPTQGRYQQANLEIGVAGDTRYARGNVQYQEYFALSKKLTLGVNGEFAAGRAMGNRTYPVYKTYFGGGLGTVRGFDQNSLGPVDLTGAYLGGTKRFNINSELYVPFPGAGNDRSLRLFGYADAGNVWGEQDAVTLDSLRASAGIGLSWISPIGPLKLSWGLPLRKQPQDKLQKFQFQIGTAF